MRYKVLLLAAVSQISFAGAAFAQDAQPGTEAGGTAASGQAAGTVDDAIIVTARRRDERLVDVPISVTALSGDTLERKMITDVSDLANNVPSLSVSFAGGSRTAPAYAIRGQKTGETQILTDPPVGLYFAEVNQPRTMGLGASYFDLQSIQVLKGVQGTLFGRNMTGGAVLIEPAHPTDAFEGNVKAGIGNYDERSLEGMVNVPLGKIGALRFAGRIYRRDGYVTDMSNGRDYNDDHSDAFRVSLRLNQAAAFC